jgi:hypothetical protein
MPAQAILLIRRKRDRIEQERLFIRSDLIPNTLLSIPLADGLGINLSRNRADTLKDDRPNCDLTSRERAWLIPILDPRWGWSRRDSE